MIVFIGTLCKRACIVKEVMNSYCIGGDQGKCLFVKSACIAGRITNFILLMVLFILEKNFGHWTDDSHVHSAGWVRFSNIGSSCISLPHYWRVPWVSCK